MKSYYRLRGTLVFVPKLNGKKCQRGSTGFVSIYYHYSEINGQKLKPDIV